MTGLPTVTVLTVAYNAAAFIGEALDSALAQDYPAGLVDIVVVDDGSTDDTAAIVADRARRHPGRIALLRQDNAGNVAATNTGVAHLHGELTAVLDADDLWPADKLHRQVAAFTPETGLVYGDMTVIDAGGAVLQESWLAGDDPPSGRCAGALLTGNPVTGSSILARTALVRAVTPIPAEIPWADWWLAVRAAQLAGLGYLPEPRTLYRFHGDNTTLGVAGEGRQRELVKAARFQRWFLRRIDFADATAAELYEAWRSFERNARETVGLAGSAFAPVVEVTAEERLAARRLSDGAAEAFARGAWREAAIGFLHAAATDPWQTDARDGLVATLACLPDGAELPGQRPLQDARPFVVLADAAELLESPGLLAAYAREMSGLTDVTLALDASALEPHPTAARLADAVLDAGIADDDTVDVVAVMGPLDEVGRARLLAGARVVYSERPEGVRALPHFGAASLADLRALAAPRLTTYAGR